MADNKVAQILHDVGAAAWFGGSLMGAVGVNGAAADVDDPRQRARVANAGWARWTPVNAAAIGIHLLGGAQLVRGNASRVKTQKGVAGMTIAKLVLTAGALATTGYARIVGQRVIKAGDVPTGGGTTPISTTPPEVASAQKQLKALQWAVPAFTGAIVGLGAYASQQQRPTEVAKGVLGRLGQSAKLVGYGAGAKAVGSVVR